MFPLKICQIYKALLLSMVLHSTPPERRRFYKIFPLYSVLQDISIRKMMVLWDTPTINSFIEWLHWREYEFTKYFNCIQFYRIFPPKRCRICKTLISSTVLQKVSTERKMVLWDDACSYFYTIYVICILALE